MYLPRLCLQLCLTCVVGQQILFHGLPPAWGQDIPIGSDVNVATGPLAPVAIHGTPFGVLQAEFPLPPNLGQRELRILVEDAEGRVFYPVVSIRKVDFADAPPASRNERRGRLRERILSAVRGEAKITQVPVAVTVSALFRGQGPIELRLVGDINQSLRFEPGTADASAHQQLVGRWWSDYTTSASKALESDDFPKLVHQYLASMLARRMNLPQVDLDPPDPDKKELSQPLKTLELLAAIEPLREAILEDVLNFPGESEPASLLVPSAPVWQTSNQPPPPVEVAVETLATRVPPECFYLRFGSFNNFVWFHDMAERHGGDIGQAVLLRGFNYDASARMEGMMAAKMTTIAKLFGDKIIGDMAVIGSDLYLREGASLGVVFATANPALLNAAIMSDRQAVAAKTEGATLQEISISGKTVSFLSTPDNRVRSFYVNDGNYVFITTSQTLVRRFLEVGAGDASLAQQSAFRWARSWMPDVNGYAVFAYFSPEFFHRLVSPQYQIELRRRLEATAYLEIAEMAEQAARAEGMQQFDLANMQAAGLIPPWFERRADGARALASDDGWIDSLRGARGSFLPIADVEIQNVSRYEASNYAAIADFYENQWKQMDPMLFGLRRFGVDGSQAERVAVEAYIAPFVPEKYGWIAQQLGGPTPVEIQLPTDDVASLQVHVKGGTTLGITADDYHLFVGVKDMIPPDPANTKGLIRTLRALQAMPAYLGAWPKPGIVEQLPLGLGLARPDIAGFSRLLFGLWRWENGQFSLLSFNRSIIENAIPHLQPLQTADRAQARLKVANLEGSKISTWINRKWYERGWRSSHGNGRLLDTMTQQLKVPGEQSLQVAERLLDLRLQCPLGGDYQFVPLPSGGGKGWWESTAWQGRPASGKPLPPAEYMAPWIEWFRGGRAHVTQGPNSLSLVGEVTLEMRPLSIDLNPGQSSLPSMNFDVFSLPMKLFGNGQAKAQPEATRQQF